MKKVILKVTSLMLAIALVMQPFVYATAETARGKTIKLDSFTGEIEIKTGAGTVVTATEGMRVFNGYKIRTKDSSYVYLNLDDKKAIKLDQNTEVNIKKWWFRNEVQVVTGSIFFNVTEKLGNLETMDIVAPTMAMAIRGTSGCVVVKSEKIVGQLYTGKVQVREAKTNRKIALLTPGKEIVSTNIGQDQNKIEIKDLSKDGEGIPSIALKEIVNDSNLRGRIENETDLELNKIDNELLDTTIQEENKEVEKLKTEIDKANKEAEKSIQNNDKLDTSNSSVTGKSTGGGSSAKEPFDLYKLIAWCAESEVRQNFETIVNEYMVNYSSSANISGYNALSQAKKYAFESIITGEADESFSDMLYSFESTEYFVSCFNETISTLEEIIGYYMLQEYTDDAYDYQLDILDGIDEMANTDLLFTMIISTFENAGNQTISDSNDRGVLKSGANISIGSLTSNPSRILAVNNMDLDTFNLGTYRVKVENTGRIKRIIGSQNAVLDWDSSSSTESNNFYQLQSEDVVLEYRDPPVNGLFIMDQDNRWIQVYEAA